MEAVGIVCEYNPLHKGHIHHIEETKKLFPGKTLILVLNGYFLERGEISILSKENKTRLALIYGVDLVVELPFIFGTQSADIFAEASIKILNYLGCKYIVFGSESNDIKTLEEVAKKQSTLEYNDKVKALLDTGVNYPTALAKALEIDKDIFNPNDLLGISYIKAIHKTNSDITPISIKRTSNYHDLDDNAEIISASNIRNKIKEGQDISLYVPRKTANLIENITLNELFPFIKYKIITDKDEYKLYDDIIIKYELLLKKDIDDKDFTKILEENKIDNKIISITDEMLEFLIDAYTSEAGVRELYRALEKIIRKLVVLGRINDRTKISKVRLKDYLGIPKFVKLENKKHEFIGRVNALGVNSNGGIVLPVESCIFEGKGNFTITGMLGKTMEESTNVALSFIKANIQKFNLNDFFFNIKDIHIHFLE